MPKILTVGIEEFEYPLTGEQGQYGEEATDWATAVSDALSTVQQRNDIPSSSATILNGAITATAIPGFSFDTSEVISINCEFIITRTTLVPALNLVESGFIQGNFDGSSWNITIESVGDAGILLDITSGGQVVYTSSSLTGSNYTGSILFKAKVFNSVE